MSDVAMLVAPSVRWHDEYGYALAKRDVHAALALGARGVWLHGGPARETATLLAALRAASPHEVFAAAELGDGAGGRFAGLTALPPLAALDVTDLDAVRRAATVTAREARALGINWIAAPSCVVPANVSPLERAHTFAAADAGAGAACGEWIDACQADGVVCMPWPYPLMRASTAEAALDSGAGAMLLAPRYAADANVIAHLRDRAGYSGVIAVQLSPLAETRDADEDELAVQCVAAGCDLLLDVDDVAVVVRALRRAAEGGDVRAEHVRAACQRVDARASWAAIAAPGREPTLDDVLWARRASDAAVHVQRGHAPALQSVVELIVVDDDPPRYERAGAALESTLSGLGYDVRVVREPAGDVRAPLVVALVGDRRLELGFTAYSDGALEHVRTLCERAARAARDVVVVHFTPPEFAAGITGVPVLVCAWTGTRGMEEAAARWLARGTAGGATA